jgi:CRP-like cAMP-binding protein
VISIADRVKLLRRVPAFSRASDESLELAARSFTEMHAGAGHRIIAQGSRGTMLYLIYSGKARVSAADGAAEKLRATLGAGELFGEASLLTGRPRTASVIADAPTTLLVLSATDFKRLHRSIPGLRATLQSAVARNRLARTLDFKWLEPGEQIYFLSRKHWVRLVQTLLMPALSVLLPVFLVAWGLAAGAFWPVFLGGVLSVAVMGWMIWTVIDWTNDYYIVTDQRVVWLEKVIGLYDSRQEAPLSTLLSVGVETDLVGRMLDYGSVIVRTFVGQIRFYSVGHPNEAATLISEQWERSKEVSSDEERAAMKKALEEKFRANLGLAEQAAPEVPAPSHVTTAPSRQKVVFSLAGLLGGHLFSVRFEESGTITYRKHWFVLLKRLFRPTAFVIVVLAWVGYRMSTLLADSGTILRQTTDGRVLPDTLIAALLFLVFPLALWWAYEYLDWRNDIFQVTAEQVLDIDKKPLGTEQRRVAQLDQILSTQSSRIGFAGYLLNFGTVYITVGGSQLAFEDVSDPSSVQGDIDRRRAARLSTQREGEARLERERIADWLVSYHENTEALEKQRRLARAREAPEE